MSKDIQMFQISDKNDVVGTEIFDPNLPSNIDFQEKIEDHHENTFINPEKKLPEMSKILIIGDEVKSFSVKGKLVSKYQPQYQSGIPIVLPLHTHQVKMEDEEASGLKKLWSSIVGHSKREMLVQDGFVYFFQRHKQGLLLRMTINLANLFKVFVDPEQERIRLVIKIDEHLSNKDLYPQNFILATEMINHELNRIGFALVE